MICWSWFSFKFGAHYGQWAKPLLVYVADKPARADLTYGEMSGNFQIKGF